MAAHAPPLFCHRTALKTGRAALTQENIWNTAERPRSPERGKKGGAMESARAGTQGRTWPWRALAAALILGAAALRLVFLAHGCRLDLAPDEAHYWDWSRHLDWSYYSKGPLIAWLVAASTSLLGNTMPVVRLPAVLCGTLLLASMYVLTVETFGRRRLGASVVALALTLPPIAAGATLMTIDAPYTCCWGWALVLGYRAALRGNRWAWPACGAVVGLGILAKYTMLLWLPSFAL